MSYKRSAKVRLAVLVIAAAAALPALAQQGLPGMLGQPGFGPRPQNFTAGVRIEPAEQAPGGRAQLLLDISCRDEYYVWHESIEVTPVQADGVVMGDLLLPAPKEKHDPFAEGPVKYLDGRFTAALLLEVAADAEPGERELVFKVEYTGCGPDVCLFKSHELTATLRVVPGAATPPPQLPPGLAGDAPGIAGTEGAPVVAPMAASDDATSLLTGHGPLLAVLLAYIGGLLLTFTPCVYPLIPVTVAVIGATSGTSRADALLRSLVYVFGISITYSAAGVAAAATGGMFGAWAQHPAVYLVLAVLFVALAGGMFDLFVIDVSSQRLHRLQAALKGRAGLAGILLIGILSGAAATACIAPVLIGVFAYVSQHGSLMLGFLIFFAMAWGLGTPLVVVGTFAGAIKAMPKSGEWMNVVKHVFGLALLGVAVYFVGKSRLLPDVAVPLLWGAFLLGASVFVGAFDALGPESGGRARLRKTVGLLLLAGALGAFFQPILSAVPAPQAAPQAGVQWVGTADAALQQAEAEGKPVLLDFWADWCVPCRQMDKTTFRDPGVVAESGRFVLAKVDVSDWSDPEVRRVREQYGVQGAPTVILIDSAGTRRTFGGYIGPADMLELLRAVQ